MPQTHTREPWGSKSALFYDLKSQSEHSSFLVWRESECGSAPGVITSWQQPEVTGFKECSYLRFLKRGHAAAQHGAAVPANLQEDLFVVSCTAVLRRFQHCRQSGSVDDQPVIHELVRQAAENTRICTSSHTMRLIKKQRLHDASSVNRYSRTNFYNRNLVSLDFLNRPSIDLCFDGLLNVICS